MHTSGTPHFQLGSGFWANTPQQDRHELLGHYTIRAQEALTCLRACLPSDDRLRLIIEAAMEARGLFFVAAMAEPTTEDLDKFVEQFVTQSVFGIAGPEGGSLDD
jgi:hypothetical protein